MKGKEKGWNIPRNPRAVRREYVAIQNFKRMGCNISRPSCLLPLFEYVDLQVGVEPPQKKQTDNKLKIEK